MRPAGFEPATCGLGNRRSIHLSYGRGLRDACDSRPSHGMLSIEPVCPDPPDDPCLERIPAGPVDAPDGAVPRVEEEVRTVVELRRSGRRGDRGRRGIGRGIVGELAALGFSVVVNYRSDRRRRPRRPAARPRSRALRRPLAVQADVADLAEGRRLLERDAGRVRPRRPLGQQRRRRARDAGVDLLETTPESWDRVLGTNLRGPVLPDPGRRPGDARLRRAGGRSPSPRSSSSPRSPARSPA